MASKQNFYAINYEDSVMLITARVKNKRIWEIV